jgi:hypothetical protein
LEDVLEEEEEEEEEEACESLDADGFCLAGSRIIAPDTELYGGANKRLEETE